VCSILSYYLKKNQYLSYKIPFLHIPDSIALDNNKSARDNTKFVTEEVEKLINKGCACPVTEKPYVVNPLTVAHNKGSLGQMAKHCKRNIGFPIENLSTFCQLETFANGDMRFLNHMKIPNFLY
jgi:hypothetical protein